MRTQSWLVVIVPVLFAATPALPFLTRTAHAQTSASVSSEGETDPEIRRIELEEEATAGTARSAAADKLTNHLLLHGDVGVAFPTGSIASGRSFADNVGPGLTLGGGLGLGLSRYVVLDVGATYSMLSAPSTCSTCSGSSYDIGLGLTYHLVQGVAIDPWISFGVGYRSVTFTQTALDANQKPVPDATYDGIDLVRIGLGGEFFPLPWAGVGPYFQFAAGTTIRRPEPELRPAVYTVFQMGLRIEFDVMGRRTSPPVTTGASGHAPRGVLARSSGSFSGSREGGPRWERAGF